MLYGETFKFAVISLLREKSMTVREIEKELCKSINTKFFSKENLYKRIYAYLEKLYKEGLAAREKKISLKGNCVFNLYTLTI